MKNLFKKGFASLALASAMTSGIFAGNAAYIDIKINYLGGEGVAVLGYNETDEKKNDDRDKVELLISILDEDGAYADKAENGEELGAIGIEDNLSNTSGTFDGTIINVSRALEEANSIQRIVLDYTLAIAKIDLINVIKITSGKLERKATIKLASVDAVGLIVRATPNGKIKDESFVNANFSDINVTGESRRLNRESSKAPGGVAGVMIPLQVYASNFASNTSVDGNFTLAPNLDGKTIVIQALASYNDAVDSTPTVLNSIEVTMTNGQASGEIKISNAMPGDGHGVAITPADNARFELVLSDGLGIAFVAYVKDEQSINNYSPKLKDDTKLDKFDFDLIMAAWGSTVAGTGSTNTDTIQVISGGPASLKVGTIDLDAKSVAKLWEKTSSTITISDGTGTSFALDNNITYADTSHKTSTKVLTVVDSYGNPAMVTELAANDIKATAKFGSKTINKLVTVAPARVVPAPSTTGVGFVDSETTINVVVTDRGDGNDTVAIKSVDFTIDVSTGMLSALAPVTLTARTLPLIEYNVEGGSSWKNAISDIITTDDFKSTTNVPLIDAAKVIKANENDITIVIKSGLDDDNLSDSNSTFRVFILDKADEDEEYLSGTDLTTKYEIIPTGIGKITFGTAATVLPFHKASDAKGYRIDGISADDGGYVRFDYNSSNVTSPATAVDFDLNITKYTSATARVSLAGIQVRGYNAKDNEDEIIIHIPVFEDKNTDAYVNVYLGDDIDIGEALPGTLVNFKFTGKAIKTGDPVEIDMNSSGLNVNTTDEDDNGSYGRIGLVGSDIADITNGILKTTLPESGIVSVVLYDANGTDKGYYGFKYQDGNLSAEPVTINGMSPVWLNLKDDDETKDITELSVTDVITMKRSEGGESVEIVNVALTTNSAEKKDGSSEKNRKILPATLGASNKALTTKTKVLTGIYYGLFAEETDVKLYDKYGNTVEKVDNELKDIELSATSGIELNDDGTETSIKFKESAVGTKQIVTVTYTKDDKTTVSNTITWTNIVLSKENTGFTITDDFGGFVDPNTGIFDVVDSEIVVKIVGNGNKKQKATTIKLSHANKDAKFRLVKVVDLSTNLYDNILSGLDDSITTSIPVDGAYYIVSADKAGDLTITVSSVNKDKKDKNIPISSTHTITFDEIDLDKPMVVESGVVAANGQITVEVTDKNLNTIDTLVTISDINDHNIIKAVYTDGKYIAKVSSAGTYQIEVLGVDMAENMQRFNFTRILGKGAGTLEDSLVAHGSYTIDGTFAAHDFEGVDTAFDWVYTQGEVMNQLNAKDSEDESAFKWGVVTDITVGTDNMWYMIQLTGSAGSVDAKGAYGWVLVNPNGDTFKLAGANKDGTFKFSNALYVKGTISGSKVTFAKR